MALQPLSILLSEQNAQGHCFFLVLLARTHRPLPIHLPEERQTVVPSAQQDLDLRMPTPMTISWWPDVFLLPVHAENTIVVFIQRKHLIGGDCYNAHIWWR